MTVNTTKITAGPYNGNDLADTFSYGFTVTDKTELKVYETDDEGVQTLLTVDTDYTVNIGESAGGTITRLAGALPTNYQWYIRSSFDATQDTSFGSQGAFFPEIHEQAMDKLTFLIQQILDTQSRTPVISPAYSGPLNITMDDPESGQFMRWTTDLTGLENVVLDVDGLNQSIVNANESADEADAAVVRVDDAIALLDGNAIPDLKAAAIAAVTTYDNITYSTNLVDEIKGYIFDATGQITYEVPLGAQGKFIQSVVDGVLTTTDTSEYNLLLPVNERINVVTDLGVDNTGSVNVDDILEYAFANYINVYAPEGAYLVKNVSMTSKTNLKGDGKRKTIFHVEPGGTGLTYEGAAIGEGQMVLKGFGCKAVTTGSGFGLTIKRLAFVQTEDTRFENLERGHNFTDVLISRFVEPEFKNNTVGDWTYGELGANINVYVHPITRNNDIAFLVDGDGGESTYGNTYKDGDHEYNELSFDIRSCGQTPHRIINSTFEGNTATSESNKIRVTGTGKVDFVDPLIGTFNDDTLPSVFTTDSDGTINMKGSLGKQTSSMRPLVPKKGHYIGSSRRVDNPLSDINYEVGLGILKKDEIRAESVQARNSILSYITGSVSAGVYRSDSWNNGVSGFESGDVDLVTSPIGDSTGFEVTTQLRQSTATPQVGSGCIQFLARSNRIDNGSAAISVLEQTSNVALGTLVVNWNGTSDWQMVSLEVDLSNTTTGVRLVFPAVSGIQYWGQQMSVGTSNPVALLPKIESSFSNDSGFSVDGYRSVQNVKDYFMRALTATASGVSTTTQALVSDADVNKDFGKTFECIVQERFGTFNVSSIYHINMSYQHSFSLSNSITLVSSQYSGVTLPSRVAISVDSMSELTDKALVFTTTGFVNSILIKVKPIF